jgi:DNA-binding NarL/FixJ family response regulator
MSTVSRIRVLLADDHSLFRKGVASLLGEEADFEVVGEASTGLEALAKAREVMPDVILMDLSMPEMDGVEATRRIKQVS